MTKPKFTICNDRHCNATDGHDSEIQIYQQIHRQTAQKINPLSHKSFMFYLIRNWSHSNEN